MYARKFFPLAPPTCGPKHCHTTPPLDTPYFAPRHASSGPRTFNLHCGIYGSDPSANADMVTDGRVPENRAVGCPGGYQRLSKAWMKLLAPYLK